MWDEAVSVSNCLLYGCMHCVCFVWILLLERNSGENYRGFTGQWNHRRSKPRMSHHPWWSNRLERILLEYLRSNKHTFYNQATATTAATTRAKTRIRTRARPRPRSSTSTRTSYNIKLQDTRTGYKIHEQGQVQQQHQKKNKNKNKNNKTCVSSVSMRSNHAIYNKAKLCPTNERTTRIVAFAWLWMSVNVF